MQYNILEVGYGGHPLGFEKISDFLKNKPDEVNYFGIDLPNNRLQSAELAIAMLFGHCFLDDFDLEKGLKDAEEVYKSTKPKGVFLSRMDAEKVGFMNNFFDEVHMHYVVTQPEVTDESVSKMILEAHRVLKPSGALVVTGEQIVSFAKLVPGYISAKNAIDKAGFRKISLEDEIEKMTIYSNTIKNLVDARAHAGEGYFLFTALK